MRQLWTSWFAGSGSIVRRSSLYWPIHSILAGTQIGYRVLHCWISKVGMLLGLKSQAGQAGVAGVSVHVGTGCGGVGACGCSHGY